MEQQAHMSPDPGGRASRILLGDTGWKEAHVTKRMTTAVCLYEWAENAKDRRRMVAIINRLANANEDPRRYYGPPLRRPHNHGLMADVELRNAGVVLNRPDWVDTAMERVALQLKGTFDSCGMAYEQSSSYQVLQASLWDRIARWAEGRTAELALEASGRAFARARQLRRPDLSPINVGDVGVSTRDYLIEGLTIDFPNAPPPPTVEPNDRPGTMWCPDTGWFATLARDDSLTQHAVVRFGPGLAIHGHADRGSILWWVGEGQAGIPVLVDRGLMSKDNDARRSYAVSSAAHSTLQWAGSTAASMQGELTAVDDGLTVALRSDQQIGTWRRTIDLPSSKSELAVTDIISGSARTTPHSQRFTLDPRWTVSGGTGAVIADGGWRLTVKCTVDGASVRPTFVTVEHFPESHESQSALAVDCRSGAQTKGTKSTLVATLTVTRG